MSYLSQKFLLRRPFLVNTICRTYSAAVEAAMNLNVENEDGGFGYTLEDLRTAKPFESIPGPKIYPFFGSLLSYKPFGSMDFYDKRTSCAIINERYGPISRYYFPFLPLPNVVELLDPKDFEMVYRNEGKFPVRPPHYALEKYKRSKGQCPGLSSVNGGEWWQMRKSLNPMMMKPKVSEPYFETHDLMANDLIDRVKTALKNSDNHSHPTLMSDMIRWALESVGAVVFDKRLGSTNLDSKNNSMFEELITNSNALFKNILPLSLNPIYKMYDRIGFRAKKQIFFENCLESVRDINIKLLNEAKEGWQGTPEMDLQNMFLPQLMGCKELTHEEKLSLLFDLVLSAMDTTVYTLTFVLFHLAKNPDIQERLFNEIDKNIGRNEIKLEYKKISKQLYLRACLKEANRIKPVIPTMTRLNDKDIVIRGYRIPKGTVIFMEQGYASMSPDNVDDPHVFKPERWLRAETEDGKKFNPFLTMPFGFGARMCIGRRFAEQELYIALTKLVQNFRFEYAGDDIPLKGLFMESLPVELDFIIHER